MRRFSAFCRKSRRGLANGLPTHSLAREPGTRLRQGFRLRQGYGGQDGGAGRPGLLFEVPKSAKDWLKSAVLSVMTYAGQTALSL